MHAHALVACSQSIGGKRQVVVKHSRLVFLTLVLIGCGSDGPRSYEATIVRTEFGIPHVSADNWGDLGFGAGYAYAEDNFCVLMREVIFANGTSARWLGESEGDVAGDFVYTFINTDEYIQTQFIDTSPPELQELLEGYAAGLSKYLEDTGVENLPEGDEGCRGEAWVRPITPLDLGKVYRKLIVRASTAPLIPLITTADPPVMASRAPEPRTESLVYEMHEALGMPEPEAMGSNAYGIGADASQTEHGILLGNPHFPWRGPLRWYIQHLTVEGEYDVMGASLQGVPLVNIGFNQDFAWSHTVSTGQRFTFYSLDLVDGDPFSYRYGDEVRTITPNPVTIEVMTDGGAVEERSDTIYMSHYGPIIDLGLVEGAIGGWPNADGQVFTFRDANINNSRAIEQFLRIGQSRSVDDLDQALRIVGLPWVNTIAADRGGDAYYADVTTVPGVSAEMLSNCADNFTLQAITAGGTTALNGSRPDCEWATASDGPDGLLGFEQLPKLRTREYVGNANDSYWLSNPDQLLTGFSPLIGREGVEQSLRTRLAFVQAEDRLAGADGLGESGFTVENVQSLMFGNRDLAAELIRDDVLTLCDGVDDWSGGDCEGAPYSANPTEAAQACDILRNWDGLYDNESVGAGLWNEFWRLVRDTPNLWAVPFDAIDPVGTPRGLSSESETGEAVRCTLGAAVDLMVSRETPLDRPWGELQFRPVGDSRIPIHGGSGRSTFSVIVSRFVDGQGYADIPTGNSYIQTVTWTEDPACPDAYALLTYSQSTNPASPFFADQTQLYSDKAWNDMPFCAADIEAATISTTTISSD